MCPKERGILFSAPMVRAVLAGTKTQTRRAMSLQPSEDTTVHVERFHQTVIDRRGEEQPGPEIFGAWWHDGESGLRCPYGQPGDRLWVREAWRTVAGADDIPPRNLMNVESFTHYEADAAKPLHVGKLRPSMFMPRWASRITLEITDVRVDRLQDISDEDLAAEGIQELIDAGVDHDGTPRDTYRTLWDALNGCGSWAANPWVWAVSFRRVPATSGNAKSLPVGGTP